MKNKRANKKSKIAVVASVSIKRLWSISLCDFVHTHIPIAWHCERPNHPNTHNNIPVACIEHLCQQWRKCWQTTDSAIEEWHNQEWTNKKNQRESTHTHSRQKQRRRPTRGKLISMIFVSVHSFDDTKHWIGDRLASLCRSPILKLFYKSHIVFFFFKNTSSICFSCGNYTWIAGSHHDSWHSTDDADERTMERINHNNNEWCRNDNLIFFVSTKIRKTRTDWTSAKTNDEFDGEGEN